MFTLLDSRRGRNCSGPSRREFLRVGSLALGGLSLPGLLAARAAAAAAGKYLQDKSVVPLLVQALEDDHAYVRSCAALGLGRLRAVETRERLTTVMEEDWDQTVRSRAKEALERITQP